MIVKMHSPLKPPAFIQYGQSLAEYGLVLVLIGLVCIAGLGRIGLDINTIYTNFTQYGLNSAPGQPPPPMP
jgi:Flp pilus assembly pilin Flp